MNWHLLTSKYRYPDPSDTIHGSGAPSDIDDNGPGFKCFMGYNIFKRRLGQYSYHDYRAQTDSNRTGLAGFFGFYYAQVGSADEAGPRIATCSWNNSEDSRNPASINGGNPSDDLRAGTEFEYTDRARFLVANGTSNSSLSGSERMTGDRPKILPDNNNGYSGVTAPSRLNMKFAAARTGLDFERNYKSNRDLLG
jgi:hypothetical protein